MLGIRPFSQALKWAKGLLWRDGQIQTVNIMKNRNVNDYPVNIGFPLLLLVNISVLNTTALIFSLNQRLMIF